MSLFLRLHSIYTMFRTGATVAPANGERLPVSQAASRTPPCCFTLDWTCVMLMRHKSWPGASLAAPGRECERHCDGISVASSRVIDATRDLDGSRRIMVVRQVPLHLVSPVGGDTRPARLRHGLLPHPPHPGRGHARDQYLSFLITGGVSTQASNHTPPSPIMRIRNLPPPGEGNI